VSEPLSKPARRSTPRRFLVAERAVALRIVTLYGVRLIVSVISLRRSRMKYQSQHEPSGALKRKRRRIPATVYRRACIELVYFYLLGAFQAKPFNSNRNDKPLPLKVSSPKAGPRLAQKSTPPQPKPSGLML
jgi:hypothetical protein